MKDLFLLLLNECAVCGNITAANMYSDCQYSTFKVEIDGETYEITIMQKEKTNE